MSIQWEEEVVRLLNDRDTVKVLATTDDQGTPHAVVKQSLRLEEGNLVYLELLESSQTQKNLTRSIWFNRKVSVTLKGKGGQSWQIKGKPVKAIVAGEIFEKNYLAVRERLGDVDLAAVWVIRPEEVVNETYGVRKAQQEANRPILTHLDRLAKKSEDGSVWI